MTSVDSLADRVSSVFGLAARPRQSEQLENALRRLAATHRLTPTQMALRLQHDRTLLRDLASAITVQETHFFRHQQHFEYLLAMLQRHGSAHPLRVFCAGCSTGAEPYSLVIAIREAGLDAARIEIVACDMSGSAIEQARAGSYSDWEFRETPERIRDRYFRRNPDGRWQLAAGVRERVTFHHSSIQEHLCGAPPPTYDVILCRNVTVYLHAGAQQDLYACMARALSAGGRLLIAPTDPCPSAPPLARTNDPDATAYALAQASCHPSAAGRASEPTRRETAPSLPPRWETREAALHEIRALADGGKHAEALRRLEPICMARPAEARLHLLRGQIYLAAERWQEAVDALARGVGADPVDPLTRYWLVVALRDAGRTQEALAEAEALNLSLESPSVRVRMQEGEITVQEMEQAVRHLEEELR